VSYLGVKRGAKPRRQAVANSSARAKNQLNRADRLLLRLGMGRILNRPRGIASNGCMEVVL
jgi:hypothetical protein